MMLEGIVTWSAALSLPIWLLAEEIVHRAHVLMASESEPAAEPQAVPHAGAITERSVHPLARILPH